MKNTPSTSRVLGLCVLAMSGGHLVAAGSAPQFRETPATLTPGATVTSRSVAMRGDEVAARPSGFSGKSSKEFMPTMDAGEGNFEKRNYGFSLSINQGYDDNIYTSSFNEEDSFFTSASLGIHYGAGNGRSSIDLAANIGGAYYWDRNDEYDPQMSFSLEFAHIFSPKFRLDISTYLAYQSEPDLQTGFGQERRNGDYFFGNIGLDLSQQWSRRFSTVYSYAVQGVFYDDDSQFDRGDDRFQHTFGLQLRYLVKPTITLAAEYRYQLIRYENDFRDSQSNFALVGADFTINRRLSASIRAGAQFRDADDTGSDTSPFVENSFSYKLGDSTSANWTNRYGFEEADSLNGVTRRTYRTGISATHRFSTRITGNAGSYVTYSTYDGGDLDEETTLDLNAGVVYAINRVFSLQGGYTYTEIYSDDSFREYQRNRVYVGVTAGF